MELCVEISAEVVVGQSSLGMQGFLHILVCELDGLTVGTTVMMTSLIAGTWVDNSHRTYSPMEQVEHRRRV